MATQQEKFWSTKFGDEYIERNKFTAAGLDSSYMKKYMVSRVKMNRDFLGKIKVKNVFEAGCNIGNQLLILQKQGFKNLFGIDINEKSIELAKLHTKGINIIYGSVFDIPFKDSYFDLVFTSGLLIHINPRDLPRAMKELYRVSKKYIWGWEYFNEYRAEVIYRGHRNKLWKDNFAEIYRKYFPNLKLIKEKKYPNINSQNVDSMFLLKK